MSLSSWLGGLETAFCRPPHNCGRELGPPYLSKGSLNANAYRKEDESSFENTPFLQIQSRTNKDENRTSFNDPPESPVKYAIAWNRLNSSLSPTHSMGLKLELIASRCPSAAVSIPIELSL
jgi:hypothetical protein